MSVIIVDCSVTWFESWEQPLILFYFFFEKECTIEVAYRFNIADDSYKKEKMKCRMNYNSENDMKCFEKYLVVVI